MDRQADPPIRHNKVATEHLQAHHQANTTRAALLLANISKVALLHRADMEVLPSISSNGAHHQDPHSNNNGVPRQDLPSSTMEVRRQVPTRRLTILAQAIS